MIAMMRLMMNQCYWCKQVLIKSNLKYYRKRNLVEKRKKLCSLSLAIPGFSHAHQVVSKICERYSNTKDEILTTDQQHLEIPHRSNKYNITVDCMHENKGTNKKKRSCWFSCCGMEKTKATRLIWVTRTRNAQRRWTPGRRQGSRPGISRVPDSQYTCPCQTLSPSPSRASPVPR